MRKFRKIFRPTTTVSTTTTTTNKNENIHTLSSPESTLDETSYMTQAPASVNKQLFTGRQKNFFIMFFFLIFT